MAGEGRFALNENGDEGFVGGLPIAEWVVLKGAVYSTSNCDWQFSSRFLFMFEGTFSQYALSYVTPPDQTLRSATILMSNNHIIYETKNIYAVINILYK